jgi:hypothetical protein
MPDSLPITSAQPLQCHIRRPPPVPPPSHPPTPTPSHHPHPPSPSPRTTRYGSGIRLTRGLSVLDSTRDELWLQVVYDVSSSSSSPSKPPVFQTFWKRYSLSPPTLINVLPDIANAAAAIFDPSTQSIFIIGTCDQNSTAGGRCSYVLNPSDITPSFVLKGQVVAKSVAPDHSPVARSSDDTTFFAMMGGVGKLSDDGKYAAAPTTQLYLRLTTSSSQANSSSSSARKLHPPPPTFRHWRAHPNRTPTPCAAAQATPLSAM